MRLLKSKLQIKFFKLGFSVDILKSPSKTRFSYIGLKKFKARFNSMTKEGTFGGGGGGAAGYNYLIEVTFYLIR